MKIAIAGTSGLVGGAFKEYLLNKGHEVLSISRSDFLSSTNETAHFLDGTDAVFNFVGAPVIKRWTNKNRWQILNSRTLTTRHLVNSFITMKQKPKLFFNASAIGIYDYENIHDETSSNYGHGFLANVVKQWEFEALKAQSLGIRTICGRIGVVLDRKKAAFPKMVLPFKFGLGGPIGSGRQAISFIHIDDLVRALYFLIDANIDGAVNLVSPGYCTQKTMAQTIGKILKRPSFIPAPKLLLFIIYGKAAEVVLGGEKVIPQKLLDVGFRFHFPNIRMAVHDLLSSKKE